MIDAAPSPRPLELFFSYAHEDERYRERLERHLSTLRNEGLVVDWHDGKIEPGAEWDDEIRSRLGRADIILFLVSADFLASDYIGRVELREALDRSHAGHVEVIPVLVHPCDWGSTSLGALQALPRGAKPITTWRNSEEAYLDVAQGIRAAAEALLERRGRSEKTPSRALKRVAVAMVELTTIGDGDVERHSHALAEASEAVAKLLAGHDAAVDALHPDELSAVFGLPRLHDDDTLRAVRAVVDLHTRLPSLNDDLRRRLDVTIAARTAVDVGMLLVDDSGAMAAAARTAAAGARLLLRAAGHGEMLLGDDAYRLVSHAVRVETVTGNGATTPVRRLIGVLPDAPARPLRPRSALVGRDWEHALLRKTFERTVSDRTCRLLVLTGPPGMGKSRLAQELTRSVAGRAVVLRGACSESRAAYWPLFEIVKQAVAVEASESMERTREKIAALLEGDETPFADAQAIAGLLDLAEPSADVEASSRAVRRLLELVASRTPLVVLLDDIHLAKPAFLDLLLYIAEQSYGAPLLLLCLAWPELDDRHPQWGERLANTNRIRLEPLVAEDSDRLVENLLGGEVDKRLRRRLMEVADGNPLFIEELLAMLVDDGHIEAQGGVWRAKGELPTDLFPETVEAVVAARVDALPDAERAAATAGSVEGMRFHHDAVAYVNSAPADAVAPALAALARKELIHHDRAEFAGEASSFRHVLIRETAYQAIPKGLRAELHEAFAAWVESTAGDRLWEYEETLAYHLERAHGLRSELQSPEDADLRELGRRAGRLLLSAGRRATARGDMADAHTLLERANALLPEEDEQHVELLFELGVAQMETGKLTEALETYDAAAAAARAAGDVRTEWYARIQHSGVLADLDPQLGTKALAAEAAEAHRVFTELDDDRGLAKVWHRRGFVAAVSCQWRLSQEGFQRARRHARRAGADRDEAVASSMLFYCLVLGPATVESAIRRSQKLLDETRFRGVAGVGLAALGNLHAMRGGFDDARILLEQSRTVLEDLGQTRRLIEAAVFAASAELLAGDVETAVEHLQRARAAASAVGQRGLLSSIDAHLAEALFARGKYTDAEEAAVSSAEAAAEDDVFVQMRWRPVRARVLAQRGDFETALTLAREAVERAATTDALNAHAAALANEAEVLRLASRDGEARHAVATAVDLYRRKGNLIGEGDLLERWGEAVPQLTTSQESR